MLPSHLLLTNRQINGYHFGRPLGKLLDGQIGVLRTRLAAVDRWLRAPLGGQAADGCVDFLVEAEQVANDATVQVRAVGVGVCEIGWLEFFVPEVLEYRFGHAQLLIGKDSERTWPRGSMSWSRLPRALLALGSVWRGILLFEPVGPQWEFRWSIPSHEGASTAYRLQVQSQPRRDSLARLVEWRGTGHRAALIPRLRSG